MYCWVMAKARQSPEICFPLRRRSGLKPYYKIHLKNVLGKLGEKLNQQHLMMNHWNESRLQVPFGWCSIDCVYYIESFVVLKETCLWTGRGITGLASIADTMACQDDSLLRQLGMMGDDLLPALDIRIYFALSIIPDVNVDRVLYKPVLMESGWSSRGWILVWYDYHISLVIYAWNFKKKNYGEFYGLLKMNCI